MILSLSLFDDCSININFKFFLVLRGFSSSRRAEQCIIPLIINGYAEPRWNTYIECGEFSKLTNKKNERTPMQ